MALQLNYSRLDRPRDLPLDPTYTGALERGMMMVYTDTANADGQEYVTPSAGDAGERCAGVLWLSELAQADVPTFEDAEVPAAAAFTVTVRETPLAGTFSVIRTDTGATIDAGVGADEYAQAGKVFTFGADLAEVPVRIYYRYAISAADLASFGRRSVNNGGERKYGQVTVQYGQLDLMTSAMETQDAWVAGADVYLAAGGRLSNAGNVKVGTVSQEAQLLRSPGITQMFIGVNMNLPVL